MLVATSMVAAVVGLLAATPGMAAPAHEVLTWGRNQYGQLGNGTTQNSNLPVSAQLPAGITLSKVSGGYGFSVALTSDGQLWAWGDNSAGQLGNGTDDDSLVPVQVTLPQGVTITDIATGDDHVLALTSTGDLLAWGYNQYGQVGDESTTDRSTPVEVHLPAGTTITSIGAGAGHSLAVTSAGRVLAWGYGNTGQVGMGANVDVNPVPTEVPIASDATFIDVAGGSGHSTALTSTGQMWSWGYNGYGQLGNGNTTSTNSPVQVQLPAGAAVTAIPDARGFSSLALESNGQVLAWGQNNRGQLGDGTNTNSSVPVQVDLPAGATVSQIAAGDDHVVVLTSAGSVLTWGYGAYGQLGTGGTANSNVPVAADMPADRTVEAVGAGGYHSMAIVPLAAQETTTTLEANPQEQQYGQPVDLIATVDCPAGTATGTVVFRTDEAELGTAILEDGRAMLIVDTLGVGDHVIHAIYEGDDQCAPSTSERVPVHITEPTVDPTETSLTAEPTEAAPGEDVVLTAQVTCTAHTPTGNVTFFLGADEIGTAELDDTGTATLTTSFEEGEHQITAQYEGDDGCPPSASDPVTVTITAEPEPTPTPSEPTPTEPEPTPTEPGPTEPGPTPTEPGPTPSEPTPKPPPGKGKLKVRKMVDRIKVRVGKKVHYRIRVTNTGNTAITGASFIDNLIDVLDEGTIKGRIKATSGKITLSEGLSQAAHGRTAHNQPAQSWPASQRFAFKWTGDLGPGASAEITFTVITHKPGMMRNVVTWQCARPKARGECTDQTKTKVLPAKKH